ncbi:hypothetical protein ABIB57_002748 [Devosia sp. UYZn731]|uniref:hypothetical protein n=1 Tax=Devosia sp. UYZn731 TaxID=3156345 RepID=UPI0033993256
MKQVAAMAIACFLSSVVASQACDVAYDPAFTWDRAVDQADVVFVGRVIQASPETSDSWGRAQFEVDSWIKGGSGTRFVAANGSGSNCVMEFGVGSQRLIFVGEWLTLSDGKVVAVADDVGPPYPVTSLSDPPTPEQQAKLDYLKTITDVR